MSEVRPNFFVVGAPKCGTTSLHYYLSQHPQIFMPRHKEPHRFGSDLDWRLVAPKYRDPVHYASLFAEAGDRPRVGEASVWYLYSRRAAAEIHEYRPDARILVMLRNPVDQMFSLFRFSYALGAEDVPDFRTALELEPERKAGRSLPKGIWFVPALLYRDVARFSEQVERYYDAFGRDAVKVVLFDDFVADTPAVYADVLRFLEVDPTFVAEIEPRNTTKDPEHLKMKRFWRRHPGLKRFAYGALPRWANRLLRRGIHRLLPDVPESPLGFDPALRADLLAEKRPEIERLGRLLGRDLAARWLAAPDPAARP